MRTLIKNATIINEGKSFKSNILINNQRIESISKNFPKDFDLVVDGKDKILIPESFDNSLPNAFFHF